MSQSLDENAKRLLHLASASVELPAGTGKTQLLAQTVRKSAALGRRSLVLTHTNAGVDAIRRRLSQFRVPKKSYRVETITSWAFTLARAYQKIAGVQIPTVPDWTKSTEYVEGATRVVKSSAISRMLSLSFDHLFVDEYQDCSIEQHRLVLAIEKSVPYVTVFGDPLQAIFGFRNVQMVDWSTDVARNFEPVNIRPFPHRWARTNPELGQLTLDLRPAMVPGNTIDFNFTKVPGVSYIKGNAFQCLGDICRPLARQNESVLVLTKFPKTESKLAALLGGNFQVIETVAGNRMAAALNELPDEGDSRLSEWLATTAKKFHVGLGKLDQPILTKLKANQSIGNHKRSELQPFLSALEHLRLEPTYENLLKASQTVADCAGVKPHHREAWKDTFRAINHGLEEKEYDQAQNLAAIRSRLKHIDRRLPALAVSRTLIVKGLEFDHVVVANLSEMQDPRHLYVAISRPKKSLTFVGSSSKVTLKYDP